MRKNIVLCGVGGQGTVLASKLLSAAAMEKNISVKSAETLGMAQRGGSVFSHIRLGEGTYAPLMGKGQADFVIGFEPGEAVKMLPYLKEEGIMVVNIHPIMPVTMSLTGSGYNGEEMIAYLQKKVKNLIVVDGIKAAADLGSSKVLNVVLLGAAVRSGKLGLTMEDMLGIIEKRIPKRFQELNKKALQYEG